MTTLPNLLDALLDDDAEDLRRAFRELAESSHIEGFRNDEEYAVKLDQLYEEFALLNENREWSEDRAIAAPPKLQQLGMRVNGLTAYLAPVVLLCAIFAAIALLSQTIYMKSFSQKIFAEIAGIQLTESSPSGALKHSADQSGPVDHADSTQPDRVAQSVFQESVTTGAATHADHTESVRSDRMEQPEIRDSVEADAAPEAVGPIAEATLPPPENQHFETTIGPTATLGQQYREKGIAAYRAQDLGLALFYFDLAIEQEPESSDGFVNRGIVYYRLGNAVKAFADVDRARHIDASKKVLGEHSPQRDLLEQVSCRFAETFCQISGRGIIGELANRPGLS